MSRIIKLSSSIISSGNAVGVKEYEGPLGKYFDYHDKDDYFAADTFEMAESELMHIAYNIALKKSGLAPKDIGAIFAGDLQNQCVGSSYGLLGCNIGYFGLYGACSTSAEGLMLASVFTTSKIYDKCMAVTSSHNCAAERQYRMPIEYGGQRTPTSQWTVTGGAAFVVGGYDDGKVKITEGLPGVVVDKGIRDANNMGAAMAPAVVDTLTRYFLESGKCPSDFDMILTGDLGHEGSSILLELMEAQGYKIDNHNDCGKLIYSKEKQDTHAGGSGCGCGASVLSAYILPKIESGEISNMLYIATGAMMSPDSLKQGRNIPAIAHLLHLGG